MVLRHRGNQFVDHQSSINWQEHFYVENGYMAVGVGQSSNTQFTLLSCKLQTASLDGSFNQKQSLLRTSVCVFSAVCWCKHLLIYVCVGNVQD
jgi:hypothetical protein